MTAIEALRALQNERAECVTRIVAIDSELAEARQLLGLPAVTSERVAPVRQAVEVPAIVKTCERCGEPFTPNVGVSGKFCSRRCYEGIPIDERRELILKALREHGPMFPSSLKNLPSLSGISGSTINNDLYVMSRDGRVTNGDDGWQVALVTPEPEGADETSPLAQSSPTLPEGSLTSSVRW